MHPNPALKTCIGELSNLQPLGRAMSHAIQTHELHLLHWALWSYPGAAVVVVY
jgi:hypothetical protein